MNPEPPDNGLVIRIVVVTVCMLATICVGTIATCMVYKIPDMSGNLSAGFTNITSTLVGALIALLINTKPGVGDGRKPAGTSDDPIKTESTNSPANPVETHDNP